MKAAKNICCKECNTCETCIEISPQKLEELIARIDSKFCEFIEGESCKIDWGYSTCNLSEKLLDKLLVFRDILVDHLRCIISGNVPCLCDEELQKIIEKVLKLTTKVVVNKIYVNDSSRQDWLGSNPNCCGYDDSEDDYYKRSIEVVSDIQEQGESSIEVLYESKEVKKKEVVVGISVDEIKQSNLEISIIESKIKNCSIEVGAYTVLKKQCELDFESVSQLIECGLSFELGSKEVLACKIDTNIASNLKRSCDLELKFNIKDSTLCSQDFEIKVKQVENPEIIEKILNE